MEICPVEIFSHFLLLAQTFGLRSPQSIAPALLRERKLDWLKVVGKLTTPFLAILRIWLY